MALPLVSARQPQPSSTVSTIGFGLLVIFRQDTWSDPFSPRREAGTIFNEIVVLLACKFAERGQEAVDFIRGVVVDQADAEEAAFVLDAEALGEIQGVVVAVPGEDAAIAQKFGDIGGMVIADAHGNRGAAVVETLRIGNAVEAQPGNGQQAGDELCEHRHFVLARDAISSHQRAAAIRGAGITAPADLDDVIDGSSDPSN